MDVRELITRIVKYLLEGLMIGIAAYFIPKNRLSFEEVLTIALAGAASFAILDIFSPSVGLTMRQGAGFGLGAKLVGFP
jgi:hypothetical protein